MFSLLSSSFYLCSVFFNDLTWMGGVSFLSVYISYICHLCIGSAGGAECPQAQGVIGFCYVAGVPLHVRVPIEPHAVQRTAAVMSHYAYIGSGVRCVGPSMLWVV